MNTRPLIAQLENRYIRRDIPDFRPGDTVRAHVRIKEGEKERIQVFEGVVIKRSGSGPRETFTVRKVSYGVGVERIFPVHSPRLERIEIARFGRVRRAKLYYLRGLEGKAARIRTLRERNGQSALEINANAAAMAAAMASETATA